jgi:hypothetical protein
MAKKEKKGEDLVDEAVDFLVGWGKKKHKHHRHHRRHHGKKREHEV